MRPYCIRCRGSVETSEPNFPANKRLSLAVKMREAQKEYFKTRRGDVLADSKRLEREFDKAADAFLNPPTPDLFNAN
jgi:hypothetical protein